MTVTGNLQKEVEIQELRLKTYPGGRQGAITNLGILHAELGQHDKALSEEREAVALDPTSAGSYANLAGAYAYLNRFDEAKSTIDQARKRNLDSLYLHIWDYLLAFLRSDAAGREQQLAWAAGQPGVEDGFLGLEAYTDAYSGKLVKARELTRRAKESAERHQDREAVAIHEAFGALREALFGNATDAYNTARSSLARSSGRSVQPIAALALAFAGDLARADALTNDLIKRFPEDTVVNFESVPAIRAALEIHRGNASRAVEILQAAVPFELGTSGDSAALYPIYVRGEAYLLARQGTPAAAEFQKILDHRAIVLNEPIGALAHLGLARAYVLQGDTAKARSKYQDFLTLWKDADPDIPILKQAKAEYAKLQ